MDLPDFPRTQYADQASFKGPVPSDKSKGAGLAFPHDGSEHVYAWRDEWNDAKETFTRRITL